MKARRSGGEAAGEAGSRWCGHEPSTPRLHRPTRPRMGTSPVPPPESAAGAIVVDGRPVGRTGPLARDPPRPRRPPAARSMRPTCAAVSTRRSPTRSWCNWSSAPGDDELAGRVVIQRILGGLISQAMRHRSQHDDVDPAEIIVAAAWIALRRYDTTRRSASRRRVLDLRCPVPGVPAAAAATGGDRAGRARSIGWNCGPRHRTRTAFERLADVVRTARLHGVPDDDLQLIRDLAAQRVVDASSPPNGA